MTRGGDITLKQLRCLVALGDRLHFRRAAEDVGVTQPSLSAQIQNLEGALGLSLVDRSPAGVALTPAGREIVERAKRMLACERTLRDFAAAAQTGVKGTIRLGAAPTIGPYLLPHIVSTLHRKDRTLGLYVREDAPHSLEYDLARGEHDLLLTPLPPSSADFVSEILFREPLYLAVAADHALAKVEAPSLKDIKGERVLALSARHQLHDQVAEICEAAGATIDRNFEGTSVDALRHMVGMGMGVTFLPALYAHSEIRAKSEIALKRISGRLFVRSIALVWRKGAGAARHYKEIARIARDVVREKFSDILL
ncbi:MAG: hydrogen peroxide-inducible genes activator [Parvularculaceae bacterium]|nr:hydrogen peroxide-inducible genes activator [Parvularculaceae bacterium]